MVKVGLKSGSLVKIISGDFRGIVGNISRIEPRKQRVYLDKVVRKQHDRRTPESRKKSELKTVMVPIHISNVKAWKEEKKTTDSS